MNTKTLSSVSIAMVLLLIGCFSHAPPLPPPDKYQSVNRNQFHVGSTLEVISPDILGFVYVGPREEIDEYNKVTPFCPFDTVSDSSQRTITVELSNENIKKLGLPRLFGIDKKDSLYYSWRISCNRVVSIKDKPKLCWGSVPELFKGKYIRAVYYGNVELLVMSRKKIDFGIDTTLVNLGFGYLGGLSEEYVYKVKSESLNNAWVGYEIATIYDEMLEPADLKRELDRARSLLSVRDLRRAIAKLSSLLRTYPKHPAIQFDLACSYSELANDSSITDPKSKESLLDSSEYYLLESIPDVTIYYTLKYDSKVPFWRIQNDSDLVALFEARPKLYQMIELYRERAGEPNINDLDNITRLAEMSKFRHSGGGGGGCFAKGTLITLFSGITVPIEKIRIGDTLLSYDLLDSHFEPSVVLKLFVHFADSLILINNNIAVTDIHPFLVEGSWIEASNIDKGKSLLKSDLTWEKVIEKTVMEYYDTVYNLQLDNNGNFFANGVLVHNKLFFKNGPLSNLK